MGILIKDISYYLPEKKLDNHFFEQYLDTSDEWIVKRTGIKSRHFSESGVAEMAVHCAKELCRKNAVDNIKLIVACSFTDRQRMPSVSASIANACKLFGEIRAFDINLACSGFVAGLDMAENFLNVGEQAIVVGSEQISHFLDMQDRGTCILFGDGAGAVLVEKTDSPSPTSFGLVEDKHYLCMNENEKIQMDGREVFKFAVGVLKANIAQMLPYHPQYIVCHQANERIIDHVSHALKIAPEKFYKNLNEVGNTSAASIPLCLAKMKENHCFPKKTSILLCGFGAGLTYYNKLVEIECHDEF